MECLFKSEHFLILCDPFHCVDCRAGLSEGVAVSRGNLIRSLSTESFVRNCVNQTYAVTQHTAVIL